MPEPTFIYADDPETGDPTETPIAQKVTARPEDAARVLNAPLDDDGRAEWEWLILQDGTMFLACRPLGDTYMDVKELSGI